MSDDNVVPLRVVGMADVGPSNSKVLDMLESAKSRVIEDGVSKALVLLLDDQGMVYDTTVLQAGMTIPEVLALLSVCTQDAHLAMRGGV
jgi:hypothetical protein